MYIHCTGTLCHIVHYNFKLYHSKTNCYNNVGVVWWYKFGTTDLEKPGSWSNY